MTEAMQLLNEKKLRFSFNGNAQFLTSKKRNFGDRLLRIMKETPVWS